MLTEKHGERDRPHRSNKRPNEGQQTPRPAAIQLSSSEDLTISYRLTKDLLGCVVTLGPKSFRSDSAANVVWAMAKLGQNLDAPIVGPPGGRITPLHPPSEIHHGEEKGLPMSVDEEEGLVEGLVEAFLAGEERCAASGRSYPGRGG